MFVTEASNSADERWVSFSRRFHLSDIAVSKGSSKERSENSKEEVKFGSFYIILTKGTKLWLSHAIKLVEEGLLKAEGWPGNE